MSLFGVSNGQEGHASFRAVVAVSCCDITGGVLVSVARMGRIHLYCLAGHHLDLRLMKVCTIIISLNTPFISQFRLTFPYPVKQDHTTETSLIPSAGRNDDLGQLGPDTSTGMRCSVCEDLRSSTLDHVKPSQRVTLFIPKATLQLSARICHSCRLLRDMLLQFRP